MSKNILLSALCICIIILVYLLFKEPKQTDSHTDDNSQVISDRDTLKVHSQVVKNVIDSLTQIVKKRDSANAILKMQTQIVRNDLDKSKTKAQQFAGELQVYKQKDTSAYDQQVDSLIKEVDNLTFLLNQYENYSDSLTTVNEQQRADMATVTNEQQNIYKELNEAYDRVSKQYDNLFKDYQSTKKTIKRERLKTKIAAVLALVGGAAAVLK